MADQLAPADWSVVVGRRVVSTQTAVWYLRSCGTFSKRKEVKRACRLDGGGCRCSRLCMLGPTVKDVASGAEGVFEARLRMRVPGTGDVNAVEAVSSVWRSRTKPSGRRWVKRR